VVWLLRKCEKCHNYTLKTDACPVCGGKLHVPHPAKYSPDDKYMKYRLAYKKQQEQAAQ
jgi:H/ACA ribonucleoprotein complex subunit 3